MNKTGYVQGEVWPPAACRLEGGATPLVYKKLNGKYTLLDKNQPFKRGVSPKVVRTLTPPINV